MVAQKPPAKRKSRECNPASHLLDSMLSCPRAASQQKGPCPGQGHKKDCKPCAHWLVSIQRGCLFLIHPLQLVFSGFTKRHCPDKQLHKQQKSNFFSSVMFVVCKTMWKEVFMYTLSMHTQEQSIESSSKAVQPCFYSLRIQDWGERQWVETRILGPDTLGVHSSPLSSQMPDLGQGHSILGSSV